MAATLIRLVLERVEPMLVADQANCSGARTASSATPS